MPIPEVRSASAEGGKKHSPALAAPPLLSDAGLCLGGGREKGGPGGPTHVARRVVAAGLYLLVGGEVQDGQVVLSGLESDARRSLTSARGWWRSFRQVCREEQGQESESGGEHGRGRHVRLAPALWLWCSLSSSATEITNGWSKKCPGVVVGRCALLMWWGRCQAGFPFLLARPRFAPSNPAI